MSDADQVRKRIEEAQAVLSALGLPLDQRKQMPALAFLALCGLTPTTAWHAASNPLIGVSPIMDYVSEHYGISYKENSRETFRKQAIHYFEAANLIVKNPDDPNRKTNSPLTAYRLTDDALSLVQSFGSSAFANYLSAYLSTIGTLVDRYAARRTLQQVPLRLLVEQEITLSPGTHSDLIERIIRDFGPRFTPNGVLIYAGDTGRKWDSYFDETELKTLGVTISSAGTKMPDVVIHYGEKNWLVVIEAFDSVGPIDPLRRAQLTTLFAASTAPLVLVTAFHTMQAMAGQARKLSWETNVWVAEAPDHLIHYNGERFLGPYK